MSDTREGVLRWNSPCQILGGVLEIEATVSDTRGAWGVGAINLRAIDKLLV